MRYTAAAVQFEPGFGDREKNIEQLVRLTAQAARAGARLVVLPEMGTTGYRFRSREEIAPYVELVPAGPTVQRFAELAAELHIYIVVGLPEIEPSTGAFYNTAALVGPHGYIGQYRKTHAYTDETRWARDGDLGIPVFATDLGRIAMLICMDADYFEPARVAALAGADVIAFPTNWENDQTPWRARALENGVYMICANRWGEERGTRFCGHSAVIDPRGSALNLLSAGEGLVLAEVDLDLARAARTVALSGRRPDQYQELLLSSYLWHWQVAQALPAGRPVVVAVGEATDAAAMADQVQWADKQARDKEWGHVDLVLFPFCQQAPDEGHLAETARRLGCHIVWGAPDSAGYHAAWVMGPEGLVSRYRHLHAEPGVTPGAEGFVTVDLPWGRLGLLGDLDLALPESARILAKRGVDLIAAPVCWSSRHDRLLWGARAMENDTAVLVANALGGSGIFDPNRPWGLTRGDLEAHGLCLGRIHTGSAVIREKELLRKLQPRWYDPLVSR